MSFMESYNDAMGSFEDGVRQTLYGDDPTDEQLLRLVERKYNADFAALIGRVLTEDTTFSRAVRRSLIREWYR